MGRTKNLWCELFKELIKINAFGDPDSPLMRGKKFSDSIHKTFGHLRK